MKKATAWPEIGQLYQVVCPVRDPAPLVFEIATRGGGNPSASVSLEPGTWVLLTNIYTIAEKTHFILGGKYSGFIPLGASSTSESWIWVDLLVEEKLYKRVVLSRSNWTDSLVKKGKDNK